MMRRACALAVVGAVAGESFEEIVAIVNAAKTTWTAAVPTRVATVEEVKPYLGAYLPGDPRHKSPPVKEIAENGVVPDSFDARTQWPKCGGIQKIRDQSACGSCWAFGSVDSFQDRACIATGKDVRYSAEDTAFCSSAGDGCDGGNTAWDWFQEEGVVTGGSYEDIGKGDTCYPYSLAPCAHHVPGSAKYKPCPSGEYPSPRCKNACSESGYNKTYSGDKVRATDSYSVRGVSQIQTELMTKGPLYVAFTVYGDFETYKSGVYQHTTGSALGGHAVELIGWGTESGTDYWLVKNSWNEQWGDGGLFKIRRGTDECGIEDDVNGGTVGASPSPGPSPPGPSPPGPSPGPPQPGNCEMQDDQASCLATSKGGKTCQWCILSAIHIGICENPEDACDGTGKSVVV